MTVLTKTIHGRRKVHYQSYEQLQDDAEEMAHSIVQTLGNWSLGQIFTHLAAAFEGSIDGLSIQVPWTARVMAPFMKERILSRPMPAGYQIPESARRRLDPDPTISTAEALDALRYAISRCQSEYHRAPNPVLGKLSLEDWDRFNLRHAELHMSFVTEADG